MQIKPFDTDDQYELLDTYAVSLIHTLPDTGANKSIISGRFLQAHGINYGTNVEKRSITQAGGDPLDCSGVVNLNVFYEGVMTPINALVSNNLVENFLICPHDLANMRVLPANYPHVIVPGPAVRQAETTGNSPLALEQMLEEYKDVFDEETLTPMAGDPMHIHLRRDDPTYKPLRITTARRTPLHFKKEADKLIKDLLARGVIEKVPANENVEWCSPGFFVPKSNGKVRLVTDYRQINKFIDRPVHPFPSCRDIIHGVKPDSRWFLKFDAVHGYFQVPLDAESARLTTFLVESGRYRFLRAPMGLNPSSDHFCERSDNAFTGVEDLLKIVDDGLLQSPTKHDLLKQFHKVLECCRKNNLTLSRSKLQFGQSVLFAGHVISQDGVKPDPRRTDAIRRFPVPTTVSELRSFLGLVNQLGAFIPDLAHATEPLRGLLKKNVAYNWLPEHKTAFEEVKSILLSKLLIKPFNPSIPSQLLTDASRLKGLGYALIQRDPEDNSISLIQCGSRSLSPTESRYSTTELECMAIYYAVKDSAFYLQGCKFEVVTDHKPLVGTFAKPLSDIENARLLRFREKLLHFNFTVTYVPGKLHLIADALSRAPVFGPEEDRELAANVVIVNRIAVDPILQSLYDHAQKDNSYKQVVKMIENDLPFANLPPTHEARLLKNVWHDLSVLDSVLLVYDDSRIIIPKQARPAILEKLHQSHSGITKTRQLARELYYWPHMSNDIKQMIDSCELCQRLRQSQFDPPQEHPAAEQPMQSVSLDLFSWAGKDYIVLVDRFSNYIWVSKLNSTTTAKVIEVLERWFIEFGYPCVIVSDNGPQFRSEFQEYCIAKHILHSPSSPYNPRSNGLAESAVKTAKYLLQKSDNFADFQCRLMAWRNVPSANSSLSPSEKFFKRRQRAQLPALPVMPRPAPPPENTSRLRPFKIGDCVRVQDPHTEKWDDKGKILEIRETGLSYLVDIINKDPAVRGRRMLKLDKAANFDIPAPPPSRPQHVTTPPTSEEEKAADKTKKKTPGRPAAGRSASRSKARRSNRRRRAPDRLDL